MCLPALKKKNGGSFGRVEPGIAVRLGLRGPFEIAVVPWAKVPSVSITVDGYFLSVLQWVDFVIFRNYGSRKKARCLSSYPHLLNAVVTVPSGSR